MTEPWNWNEEDVEELIHNGVQESLTLDYKRCAALDKRNPKSRTDLSKDVSAFANSAGGMLVYGVEEDNHLPKNIDDGYDPTDITREWLEQVIIEFRIKNGTAWCIFGTCVLKEHHNNYTSVVNRRLSYCKPARFQQS